LPLRFARRAHGTRDRTGARRVRAAYWGAAIGWIVALEQITLGLKLSAYEMSEGTRPLRHPRAA
jgi:hypothetical protein